MPSEISLLTYRTVFNLYGTERLTEWKKFRDSLEVSETPFKDVAVLWSRAPFVNPYLDSSNPDSWPDPWHLILDNRYDDLAISLGMLYTLKLTRRFMDTKCEIHTSMLPNEKETKYLLLIENSSVLNLEYGNATDLSKMEGLKTNLLWSK